MCVAFGGVVGVCEYTGEGGRRKGKNVTEKNISKERAQNLENSLLNEKNE